MQQRRAILYKYLKLLPTINHKRRSRLLVWTQKKAAGEGDIPTEGLPVLEPGINTVITLVDDEKCQLAHDIGGSLCIINGKARPGSLIHRKTFTTAAFTQVNLEDKGALAKLVESVKTNYNDRYDEIHCHWGGNLLDPKSVDHIAKLEKAKAKELATILG
ncbi:hypothetical protein GH733_013758 [Mirounga leonina]|nr:hypothetical protein GH733_013758 [Mirounga leonina]